MQQGPSSDQQCAGMLQQWLNDNPRYVRCLDQTDQKVWMYLCGAVAKGQVPLGPAMGAWAGRMNERCKPWYKKPTYIAIGAGSALLALFLFRR